MRPQRGTEPGVEHVLFLHEAVPDESGCQIVGVVTQADVQQGRGAAADPRTRDVFLGFHLEGVHRPARTSGSRVSCSTYDCNRWAGRMCAYQIGNLVAPPQLPADRPIAFFAQPIEIALGVAIGNDRHAAVAAPRPWPTAASSLHPHEPLVGQIRLDRRLAAIGVGQVDLAVFDCPRAAQRLPDPRRRARARRGRSVPGTGRRCR